MRAITKQTPAQHQSLTQTELVVGGVHYYSNSGDMRQGQTPFTFWMTLVHVHNIMIRTSTEAKSEFIVQKLKLM